MQLSFEPTTNEGAGRGPEHDKAAMRNGSKCRSWCSEAQGPRLVRSTGLSASCSFGAMEREARENFCSTDLNAGLRMLQDFSGKESAVATLDRTSAACLHQQV